MLTLIPTPIGNIADITFRALELIESCDLILCEDTRVTKHLLQLLSSRYNLELPNVDIVSFHEHNQESKLPYIKDALSKKSVLYLSDAGMPGISDPGAKLIQFAQKHNIPYICLGFFKGC